MKILVFEWMVGGGGCFDGAPIQLDGQLFLQGQRMYLALVEDLLQARHQVVSTRDFRIPPFAKVASKPVSCADSLHETLLDHADESDAILLIAPECNGYLAMVVSWLNQSRSKLVSPNLEFVNVTSSKQLTSQRLLKAGVAAPVGIRLSNNPECLLKLSELPLPFVAKPDDGAGSDGIRLIDRVDRISLPEEFDFWRVEPLVDGLPVSVSLISDGRSVSPLTPTKQSFNRPFGHYVEAQFPLDSTTARRATQLAVEAANALPPTIGIFGIDMIIGDEAVVVDVNPRVTMSYCWLREIEKFNIAQRMLDAAGV